MLDLESPSLEQNPITARADDPPRSPLTPSPEEAPVIRLEADLTDEGQFGRTLLEVTQHEVRSVGMDGAYLYRIPLADIRTSRNEPLVGGGRLEILTYAGELLPVATYSLTMAPRFSEAARGIQQLSSGEPLSINLDGRKLRCEKCNRLLPEPDGICPACIHRARTMLRIAQYLYPYRWRAVGLAGLSVITTLLNLAPPYIQGTLIDRVLTRHTDFHLLSLYVALWLATLAAGIGVQILAGQTIAFLAGRVAADIRASVYRAIEFLQISFFEKKQVGAITSRVTQDTDRVWGFLVDGLPYFVTNALLLLGTAGFLFFVNWRLALCVLSPIPMILVLSALFWKSISQLFHRVGQKWARFHMNLNEALSGIRVVKAFAQEDFENAKFRRRNDELRDAGIRADSRWYTLFGMMSFFTGLGVVINWTVGGYLVYHRQLTLGDFWKVNAYLALVYGPLQWFAQVNNWFSRAMAGAERIFEVMDASPEAYARPGKAIDIEGTVQFDSVRFGYDKSNPVLKGLSFTACPGEMIGFVGKSGAGKSTAISLICRFHEPDSGAILIDGVDYREMPLQHMRRQIGIVLQEPFLFNGSIAENIAYGKSDASFEEIIEAARAGNAHEFILAKPDGYDTMVGERGAKLSGGERQRISIARAILHNPRILILDEATSSVDLETEKQIQEAIARLIKGRTTFAIAHRLATLRNATRLIVLDGGEVAEMGTHAELMEKKGTFFDLVQTQSQISQIIET